MNHDCFHLIKWSWTTNHLFHSHTHAVFREGSIPLSNWWHTSSNCGVWSWADMCLCASESLPVSIIIPVCAVVAFLHSMWRWSGFRSEGCEVAWWKLTHGGGEMSPVPHCGKAAQASGWQNFPVCRKTFNGTGHLANTLAKLEGKGAARTCRKVTYASSHAQFDLNIKRMWRESAQAERQCLKQLWKCADLPTNSRLVPFRTQSSVSLKQCLHFSYCAVSTKSHHLSIHTKWMWSSIRTP